MVAAGPCAPWDPIWCCDLPTGSESITGDAVQAASEILYARSGQRFGLCEVTLRPCRRECWDAGPFGGWWEFNTYPYPVNYRGTWYNITCGSCSGTCSCTPLEEVYLPGPVNDIVQVKVDGVILASSAYRLDDARKLVRIDGGVWPFCNDLNEADTEAGTWSVTANYGQEVPTLGKLAVGELACEFVKSCMGDSSCKLPQPVQQLTRQGVSLTFLDPNEVFANNRIGLYKSDLFISTYNPNNLPTRSTVYSIDRPNPRRVGT